MIRIFFKKVFTNPCKYIFMGETSWKKKNRTRLHPKSKANYLSNLFFCWTFPSLAKGFVNCFKEADLFDPLDQHESSILGDKLEEAWSCELLSKKKPSLWRPIFKIFGTEFLGVGIIIFINEFFVKLSQPVLLWKLINTHKTTASEQNEIRSYIYASLIVTSSFVNVMLSNWYIFLLRDLSMKIRIACSSLIYRKSLKLDKNNISKTATGQVVNLLSNDLNRFDKLFLQIHYLWLAPLECIVILYLLYIMLDLSGTVGVATFFIFIPLQIAMGTKYSEYRFKAALKTDDRVRLINEILSGIQVIKMYSWEKLFIKFINDFRREEIRYIRRTSYLKAFQNAVNKFLSKGAVFLCILLYLLSGHHLQSQYVFVLKSFYSLLNQSMTTNFPEAIKNINEACVSAKRIQEYLMSSEIKPIKTAQPTYQKGIYLEKASAQWSLAFHDTLSEINFEATSGELITIVGTVGSGKTSLINVILQELPLKQGKIFVSGKMSYACQEPWLFAGTVRENILCGLPLDTTKYNEVVTVCALKHDFDALPFGDNSIIGNRGITLSGGQKARISLARAIYRNADIYMLDDPLSAVDPSVGKQLFEQCIVNYLKDKCVILATHQIQYLKKSNRIFLLQNGKIIAEGDYEYLRNCGGDFAKHLQKEELEESLKDDTDRKISNTKEREQINEIRNFGKIPLKIYQDYISCGGWFTFILITLMFVLSQTIQSATDYFESYWVKLENKSVQTFPQASFLTTINCIYIYSGLIIFILLFSLLTTMSFYSYFMNLSIKLHKTMFSSVIQAKLQFFHTNSSGSILNRFSKDIGAADSNVPKFLIDTIQNGLNVLAVFILVAVVNPWMSIGSVFLLGLFYFIRTFYIATSRELRRIEAISRSPVYSHLNETIQGLETIRAFGIQSQQKNVFDHLLNRNTSAFYMVIATSTTFGLWLSLFCIMYVSLVTSSCFWGQKTYGGDLGLIMTQAIGLAELLQWGMIEWSEFENEMTSVERIIQYKNAESEEQEEENATETWPLCGSIEFNSVTLRYKQNIPAALNDLSFKVSSKEKIGIVGRTGAGKTSILAALFRLVRFEGDIYIGGINITKLPLETLRTNISIIPQDPVLFSGTVRENLDPFNQFSDSELWDIINDLELKSFMNHLSSGLESPILDMGSNLSVGQKQLFCLARALLRRTKILLLDEATANIDYKTDSFILSTIKKKLVDCTVLIIAHRLHTVMDCDKILVVEAGRTVEFDHPHILLQSENSALYQLVVKTGPNMTNYLKELAQKNYSDRLIGTHWPST